MKILKVAVPVVMAALLTGSVWAEETKPEAPKPATPAVEAPKVDAPKTDAPAADAAKTEAPKVDAPAAVAPATPTAPAAPVVQTESLVGELHKGPVLSAKGKAKKNAVGNADSIMLSVAVARVKGVKPEKGAKGREVILTATGDVLTQLAALAEQKKHVKVTGVVVGDSMEVKEVSEVPAETKKKKKKDAA